MNRDFLVAEIHLQAIRRNLGAMRRRLPAAAQLCPAVKADAYGHGIRLILGLLADEGIRRLSVANLEEALQLRGLGWHRSILVFGPAMAHPGDAARTERALEAVAGDITCTVSSLEDIRRLTAAADRLHRRARIEVQTDTGMGRSGVPASEAATFIADVAREPRCRLDGVYMHFATADEPDLSFAREQLACFRRVLADLDRAGVSYGSAHAANSAAIFRLPEAHFDVVRPGLAVYGYWGGPDPERPADLQPAMRLVARLAEVRRLPAGHAVGYGCTFRTRRDSLIGTLPFGYADGCRRLLGNAATLSLLDDDNTRTPVPLVGRVSMDQINVDLTDVPTARVGDRVVIVDDDPTALNCVESIARRLGTIPYEVTTLIGPRVERIAIV
jgi:alanine racemase